MPRTARVAPGGLVYHVLNRSAGKMHLFRKEDDFEAFQRVTNGQGMQNRVDVLPPAVRARAALLAPVSRLGVLPGPSRRGKLRYAEMRGCVGRCRGSGNEVYTACADCSRSRFDEYLQDEQWADVCYLCPSLEGLPMAAEYLSRINSRHKVSELAIAADVVGVVPRLVGVREDPARGLRRDELDLR